MRTALDVFLLVDGLTLIAASRILADTLKLPGNRSTAVRLLGLADDPASATWRFVSSVIAGVILAASGLTDIFH
ncbi:hypothetical protein [Baekduia sp. Peel2402]|uniref:hypothetical protein n=1 Tax=Baekduia sp. Peel2402 TaxID=3458296 RepID=UPI00403E8C26